MDTRITEGRQHQALQSEHGDGQARVDTTKSVPTVLCKIQPKGDVEQMKEEGRQPRESTQPEHDALCNSEAAVNTRAIQALKTEALIESVPV